MQFTPSPPQFPNNSTKLRFCRCGTCVAHSDSGQGEWIPYRRYLQHKRKEASYLTERSPVEAAHKENVVDSASASATVQRQLSLELNAAAALDHVHPDVEDIDIEDIGASGIEEPAGGDDRGQLPSSANACAPGAVRKRVIAPIANDRTEPHTHPADPDSCASSSDSSSTSSASISSSNSNSSPDPDADPSTELKGKGKHRSSKSVHRREELWHGWLFPPKDKLNNMRIADFVRLEMMKLCYGRMSRDGRRLHFDQLRFYWSYITRGPVNIPSYRQIQSTIKRHSYDVKRIRICPNFCVCFSDAFKDDDVCKLLEHAGIRDVEGMRRRYQFAIRMFKRWIRPESETVCHVCQEETFVQEELPSGELHTTSTPKKVCTD